MIDSNQEDDVHSEMVNQDIAINDQNEIDNTGNNEYIQSDDDDDNFEAEKLLGKKRSDGKNYYRVKWVGFKKTTWEPEENIGDGLLTEFYTRFTQAGKRRKRPSLFVKRNAV